ncbi:MAG: ribbon-helix-helix domain-containing protein [Candidatus Bipolaricaulota bacterium]|nr:ribbon-helix-helix domain-containing protein [Candidatus Bipolaricaulota bacterium]MDW8141353.1 ribbon-helix-helix domain-containing protein [Candidatus Bipolaricaulota bacterium]
MPMQTVQVRLTKEQLKLIDERVKRGEYPNRSEAIRDYVRKAEFLELFSRFWEITSQKPFTMSELEQARARVWQKKFASRPRARKAP